MLAIHSQTALVLAVRKKKAPQTQVNVQVHLSDLVLHNGGGKKAKQPATVFV